MSPNELKRLARFLFNWALDLENEDFVRFFLSRCEEKRVRLTVKEDMVLDVVHRKNYPLLSVLLEEKVYTERISQNDKINVDALFFLDMMHGLLTAGNYPTFVKRLEKEDVVAILLAEDAQEEQIVTLIDNTVFEHNFCEVMRVLTFWRRSDLIKRLLSTAFFVDETLFEDAVEEVFLYAVKIDYMELAFHLYHQHRGVVASSNRIVETILVALSNSCRTSCSC